MNHSLESIAKAKVLWKYLRISGDVVPADVILIFGGHDPSVGPHSATLFKQGLAPLIVVSGGTMHVPPKNDGSPARTEAEAIASYLLDDGVPQDVIILEPKASNTSENFWFTADLLTDRGIRFNSCILVTKPYAERRTLATGLMRWPHIKLQISGPEITFDQYLKGGIPVRRIFSMMVGEVHRIESYSKKRFMRPERVPEDVLEACGYLERAGYNDRALKQN